MQAHCGIVNPANPCRCVRQINPLIAKGIVDPQNLLFAVHPEVRDHVRELQVWTPKPRFPGHPRYLARGCSPDSNR